MKKAKLMLSALSVVALLGTAFAFKANTFQNHVVYTGALNQDGNKTECTIPTPGLQISSGSPVNFRASTTSLATTCPQEFVEEVDNQ